MIRVLHVIEKMDRGGAETFIMNLYRNIDRNKYQFDFLVHDNSGHYTEEIKSLGGRIYQLPVPSSIGLFKYQKLFYRLLKDIGNIDAVHSHIHYLSGLIVYTAKKAKIPVRISHSHTSMDFKTSSPIRNMYTAVMQRLILRNSTLLFYCSQKAGEALFGSKFKHDTRSIFIPNSVNLENFKQTLQVDQKDIKEKFNIPTDKKIVGHVGSFTHPKNHTYLIDLFSDVISEHPDFHLVLVGDGGLRPMIEKKVDDLNLSKDVTFVGVTNNVPLILRSFDVMLFPSLFEGLPTVIVEAQAAGVPSVLSKTITSEVDMDLSLLEYISLDADRVEWKHAILHSINKEVPDFQTISDHILSKGFETGQVAKLCERMYRHEHL